MGLKTSSLVCTFVGLISQKEDFTPAQRSTICVLHLTCQQPFHSAFFLSFPHVLSLLLPFSPPSILPRHLATGRQEISTVGRRHPFFSIPPGDLSPQQKPAPNQRSSHGTAGDFLAHRSPDGAGTNSGMKDWGNN